MSFIASFMCIIVLLVFFWKNTSVVKRIVAMNFEPYTFNDYVEMIICYGEAGRNANRAALIFEERHGRRPDHKTITRKINNMRETGSMNRRRERVPNLAREEVVLEAVATNPEISLRQIEMGHRIPKSTANDILRRHHVHPYHFTPVQELSARDHQLRMNFCRELLVL